MVLGGQQMKSCENKLNDFKVKAWRSEPTIIVFLESFRHGSVHFKSIMLQTEGGLILQRKDLFLKLEL